MNELLHAGLYLITAGAEPCSSFLDQVQYKQPKSQIVSEVNPSERYEIFLSYKWNDSFILVTCLAMISGNEEQTDDPSPF